MDLLRSLIKCVYCDYSPDEYVSQLITDEKYRQQGYQQSRNYLKELLHIREQQYNDEAIDGIIDFADGAWFSHDDIPRTLSNDSFNALRYFCRETFKADDGIVKFDHLLQWRDLALYLGEDFLVCMSLSEREMSDYLWKTPIRHDYEELNAKLDEGLHDLHVHLEGGIETAELVWLRMMNDPSMLTEELNRRFTESEKDILHRFWGINSFRTLKQWVLLAGHIRKCIYNNLHNTIGWDKCRETIITACGIDSTEANNQIFGEESGFADANQKGMRIFDCASDYAMPKCDNESPYKFQTGERWLMHRVLNVLYKSEGIEDDLFDWFYLYMLIKIRFRRECVHTNMRIGLSNYNHFYSKFKIEQTIIADVKKKLEYLCSTCLLSDLDTIEVRGSVSSLQFAVMQVNKNVHLIGSLYKRPQNGAATMENIRSESKKNADKYLEKLKQNQRKLHNELDEDRSKINPIVALDTTGSDLSAHPDVIAPYLRYIHEKAGLENFSYHIAEDFMDVVDGLRALDELITFADNPSNLRLAHATALSIDINKFYRERKRNVLCTNQCLLDNLVWLYFMNSDEDKSILDKVSKKAADIFDVIYKDIAFDIEDYRKSMLLRGNMHDETLMPGVSERVLYCHSEECMEAKKSANAERLWDKYRQVNEKGNELILYRMPVEFISLVIKAQKKLLDKVLQMNLSIESCPTSNLMIGPFERYIELPTLTFAKKGVRVSVNTDTKGIFATSLYMEYSLLACAMKKEKGDWTEETLLQMIDDLLKNNKQMQFSVPKLDKLIE